MPEHTLNCFSCYFIDYYTPTTPYDKYFIVTHDNPDCMYRIIYIRYFAIMRKMYIIKCIVMITFNHTEDILRLNCLHVHC